MLKRNYTTIKIIGILCLAIGAPLSFYYADHASSAPNLHMYNQVCTPQVSTTYYIQASTPQKDRHRSQYSLAASEDSIVAWFTKLSQQQTIVLALGVIAICFVLYVFVKGRNTSTSFNTTEHIDSLPDYNEIATSEDLNTDNGQYSEDDKKEMSNDMYNSYQNIPKDVGDFKPTSSIYTINEAQPIGLTGTQNPSGAVATKTHQHDNNHKKPSIYDIGDDSDNIQIAQAPNMGISGIDNQQTQKYLNYQRYSDNEQKIEKIDSDFEPSHNQLLTDRPVNIFEERKSGAETDDTDIDQHVIDKQLSNSGNTTDVSTETETEAELSQNELSTTTKLSIKQLRKRNKKNREAIKQQKKKKQAAFKHTLALCKLMVKGKDPGSNSINNEHAKIFKQLINWDSNGLGAEANNLWNQFREEVTTLKLDIKYIHEYDQIGKQLFRGNLFVNIATIFLRVTSIQFKRVNYNGSSSLYSSSLGNKFITNLRNQLNEKPDTKITTISIKTHEYPLHIAQEKDSDSENKLTNSTQAIDLKRLFPEWNVEKKSYKGGKASHIVLTKNSSLQVTPLEELSEWESTDNDTEADITTATEYETDTENRLSSNTDNLSVSTLTSATETNYGTETETEMDDSLSGNDQNLSKQQYPSAAIIKRMIKGKAAKKTQQKKAIQNNIATFNNMLQNEQELIRFREAQTVITFHMAQMYDGYADFRKLLFASSDDDSSKLHNQPQHLKFSNVLKVDQLAKVFPNVQKIICTNMNQTDKDKEKIDIIFTDGFIDELCQRLSKLPPASQLNKIRISTSALNQVAQEVDAIKGSVNKLGWFVGAENKYTILLLRYSHSYFEKKLMPKLNQMILGNSTKLTKLDMAMGRQLCDTILDNNSILEVPEAWNKFRENHKLKFDMQSMYTHYTDFIPLLFVADHQFQNDDNQPQDSLMQPKHGLRLDNICKIFPNVTQIKCNTMDYVGTNQKNKPVYSSDIVSELFIQDVTAKLENLDKTSQLRKLYIRTAKNAIIVSPKDTNQLSSTPQNAINILSGDDANQAKWKKGIKQYKRNKNRQIVFTKLGNDLFAKQYNQSLLSNNLQMIGNDTDTDDFTTATEYDTDVLTDDEANNNNNLLFYSSDEDDSMAHMTKSAQKKQKKRIYKHKKHQRFKKMLTHMLRGKALPSNLNVIEKDIFNFKQLFYNKRLLNKFRARRNNITIDMKHMHKDYPGFKDLLFVSGNGFENIFDIDQLTNIFKNVNTITCNNIDCIGWNKAQAKNNDQYKGDYKASLVNKKFLEELKNKIAKNTSKELIEISISTAAHEGIKVDLPSMEAAFNSLGWVIAKEGDKIILRKFSHSHLKNTLISQINTMIAGKSLDKKMTQTDATIARQLLTVSLTNTKHILPKAWRKLSKKAKLTFNMQYMDQAYEEMKNLVISDKANNLLQFDQIVEKFPNAKTITCTEADYKEWWQEASKNSYARSILNNTFFKELLNRLTEMKQKTNKVKKIVIQTKQCPIKIKDHDYKKLEQELEQLGWEVKKEKSQLTLTTKEPNKKPSKSNKNNILLTDDNHNDQTADDTDYTTENTTDDDNLPKV